MSADGGWKVGVSELVTILQALPRAAFGGVEAFILWFRLDCRGASAVAGMIDLDLMGLSQERTGPALGHI